MRSVTQPPTGAAMSDSAMLLARQVEDGAGIGWLDGTRCRMVAMPPIERREAPADHKFEVGGA